MNNLSDIIDEATGSHRGDLFRARPYDGQPHTDLGERGKQVVSGITMRDIRDCFIRAVALSSGPGEVYEEAKKGERANICENDLYALDWSQMDIMASASKAALLGIPLEKTAELMQIARAAATAMGADTGQMFNDLAIGIPVALSATQSGATINAGDNFPKNGLSKDNAQQLQQITQGRRNQRIDFPLPATAGNNQRLVASTDDLTVNNQINTSIQPVFITKENIDINSARTRGFSQKIYGHINRRWPAHDTINPYAGFGAEIDFGRRPGPTPEISREKCINCALSQWGVWIKGGFSF